MRAKLKEVKEEMRRRMHQPIPEQGRWLRQVVTGYFAYHAVPTNIRALQTFRDRIIELWRRSLRRRGQTDRTTWERISSWRTTISQSRASFIPGRTTLRRQTPEVGAVCANWARSVLCGGRSVMGVPTAIRIAMSALRPLIPQFQT